MALSGGYQKTNARVIYRSIVNLEKKFGILSSPLKFKEFVKRPGPEGGGEEKEHSGEGSSNEREGEEVEEDDDQDEGLKRKKKKNKEKERTEEIVRDEGGAEDKEEEEVE